jgi:hypothetical protein
MSDIQAERETRWRRRKAAANRMSGIPAYIGMAALTAYVGLSIFLPDQPDRDHVHRLYAGGPRVRGATYATDTEFTVAIALAMIAVACIVAAAIVYQMLSPGPLYREPTALDG